MNSFQHLYLQEFKKLEKKLREIAGVTSDSVQMKDIIDKAKKNSPLITYKEGLLWDLYALRNVFAHADRERYIAQVNELAYEAIRELIELIEHPPKVGDKFSKKVYYVFDDEITEVVIQEMRKHLYTHVPVYKKSDSMNQCLGVFSEATIFSWLAENIRVGKADFYKEQIKDVNRQYLNDQNDQYKFISLDVDIFHVYKMFETAIENKKRLGAVLITPSGKKNELPIGIITAWDLADIKKYTT